jgi:hypothetical protein
MLIEFPSRVFALIAVVLALIADPQESVRLTWCHSGVVVAAKHGSCSPRASFQRVLSFDRVFASCGGTTV